MLLSLLLSIYPTKYHILECICFNSNTNFYSLKLICINEYINNFIKFILESEQNTMFILFLCELNIYVDELNNDDLITIFDLSKKSFDYFKFNCNYSVVSSSIE